MHDPYYPRDYYKAGSKTIPFDGDGSISAFRIKDGKCAFKQRYVLTERFLAERRAGRAMFGILKTPFSHHPCVRAVQDNTANTNVIVHAGKLLALSEQGPPYELDPSEQQFKTPSFPFRSIVWRVVWRGRDLRWRTDHGWTCRYDDDPGKYAVPRADP